MCSTLSVSGQHCNIVGSSSVNLTRVVRSRSISSSMMSTAHTSLDGGVGGGVGEGVRASRSSSESGSELEVCSLASDTASSNEGSWVKCAGSREEGYELFVLEPSQVRCLPFFDRLLPRCFARCRRGFGVLAGHRGGVERCGAGKISAERSLSSLASSARMSRSS